MAPALSVLRPAGSSPQGSQTVTVTAYFAEKLKTRPVVLVPASYTFSGDPNKLLGEQAEMQMLDMFEKCGQDIPGIEILCFHSIRVMGSTPIIIREIDAWAFVTYIGNKFIFANEVKCNSIIKKSVQTKKKAVAQMRNFEKLKQTELKVTTDKIQYHAFWPNMDPTDPCITCSGSHPTFEEKPPACRQPGAPPKTSPEPKGFHLFKDTFSGDEFSNWMLSIVSDPQLAVDFKTFDTVLDFAARHCIGVLFDENLGAMCVLGKRQDQLVFQPLQVLADPLVVLGLAGTGKTISVCARIQYLEALGQLGLTCRVLYIYFEENMKELVQSRLTTCHVDLTHVDFANYNSSPYMLQDLSENCQVLENLLQLHFHFIYMDGAEDMGIKKLEKILRKIVFGGSPLASVPGGVQLQPMAQRDLWFLLDPYQQLGRRASSIYSHVY